MKTNMKCKGCVESLKNIASLVEKERDLLRLLGEMFFENHQLGAEYACLKYQYETCNAAYKKLKEKEDKS